MDESVREYTQWTVDMNQDNHERFVGRMMAYIREIDETTGFLPEG